MVPLALTGLVALALATRTKARLPGVEQRFVEEHLIETGTLGLPTNGIVAAFGDYNGDQLLDLFHLSSDQRTVSVWEWDRTKYSWVEREQARITTSNDFTVVNVVPGDFDYDGKLDLLLMGGQHPGGGWWGREDSSLELAVYLQQPDGSMTVAPVIDSSAIAQPMVFDATGDMSIDLFGYKAADTKTPVLWENVWAKSDQASLFNLSSPPLDLDSFDCPFPSPHSNSYIDLDGDCLADLFLTCGTGEKNSDDLGSYQIWRNDKDSGKFVLARKAALPKGTKTVGFADMDRDGTIDLIVTACPSGDSSCQLIIAYNQQVPLCSTTGHSTEPCRDPEALCVADESFSFDFSTDEANTALTTIPISSLIPGSTLVTTSTAFQGHLPTPPALGDYNIDGYPDLLLLTSSGTGKRNVNLLQSRPCDSTSCTAGEVAAGRRAFRVITDGAEALTKITDAESATWLDVDDDGTLDILVQRSGNTGAARTPVFIKNNYFHDAFFLKAIVLNGACHQWCEPKNEGEDRYKPYGVSYSGASFKFTVLDPTGARKATQVGQLPQSSYMSLGTPYCYFGLGRTNNYVENLFIGSTRRQASHYINIEGLIPDSQVVINPYQPPSQKDTSTWTKELYLHPGDWIPWVTVVLGAAIAVLGVVVVVLHLNEKREDEIERKSRLIQLNFQAL